MNYSRWKILIVFATFSFALAAENLPSKELNREKNTQKDQKEKDSKETNEVEDREKSPTPEKLVKEGNLAFPVSQQPNPLISFGQNLLNKKQLQALLLTTHFIGKKEYFISMVPSLLYGFTDDFSVFLSFPYAVRNREGHHHSSGPEDFIVQLEYGIWTKEYGTYYDQITLVTNITIPSGSPKKEPKTGSGSNSFFIGAIYSRMAINWFYFTSYGGVLTGSSHRRKLGQQFLYQYGVGRRIFSNADWLMAWMIEFDGFYTGEDEMHGIKDPNTGGNIIYLTPSLFLSSSENLVIQIGAGIVAYQHLFGHQHRKKYLLALNLGWIF